MHKLTFVTVCSSSYSLQLLSLISSLNQSCSQYHLYVVCLDVQTNDLICSISIPNITAIPAGIISKPKASQNGENYRNYVWSLSALSLLYISDTYHPELLVYIDVDIFLIGRTDTYLRPFLKSQKTIFLTPHHPSPHYDDTHITGKYCVQFIAIKKPNQSRFLQDWANLCAQECIISIERGLYADQKYLDSLSKVYNDFIFESGPGDFLGPWNAISFPHSQCFAYHFHGLRFYRLFSLLFVRCYFQRYIPEHTFRSIYLTYLHLSYRLYQKYPHVSDFLCHPSLRDLLYVNLTWLLNLISPFPIASKCVLLGTTYFKKFKSSLPAFTEPSI